MDNENVKRESISEVLKKYKDSTSGNLPNEIRVSNPLVGTSIPKSSTFNPQDFEKSMTKETDPDLMTSYEIVKLPSKGLFYASPISEVNVEYMTSKDEDLLTTPSLIENGTALDVLLKRKIKTPGITPEDLLGGDRNAIILFVVK